MWCVRALISHDRGRVEEKGGVDTYIKIRSLE
jgi:hypothetical protein